MEEPGELRLREQKPQTIRNISLPVDLLKTGRGYSKKNEGKMKGQRGKQTTITRKQQRELKYRTQSPFLFRVYDLNSGMFLGEKYVVGFDSEEAFINADAWAAREFPSHEVHVEEVNVYE